MLNKKDKKKDEIYYINKVKEGYFIVNPIFISRKIKELWNKTISPMFISIFGAIPPPTVLTVKKPPIKYIKTKVIAEKEEEETCPQCLGIKTIYNKKREVPCHLCKGKGKISKDAYEVYIEDNYSFFLDENERIY